MLDICDIEQGHGTDCLHAARSGNRTCQRSVPDSQMILQKSLNLHYLQLKRNKMEMHP
jgi:hypothetical protein